VVPREVQRTMKSAFLVGARKFELREVPEPVAPADGLVVAVKACGICGSDLRRWKEGPAAGTDSLVPGHEVAGVVAQVGKNVMRFSGGERLAVAPDIHCGRCYYCQRELYNLCDHIRFIGVTPGHFGGFAEKMVLTGEILQNGIVHRMPDGVSFIEGSLAEPLCSVLATHQKANTSRDDTLVVMGAGPMGCLHVVLAKARGASVIVSEPSEFRRTMVQRFRPDAVVDPFEENLTDRVRELTGGVGADIVICANPVGQTQTQAVEIVRKAGRIVLFGGLPKTDHMVTLDANRIHYGEIEVVGSFSYHPDVHRLALDTLNGKLVKAELLVTHTFSLDRVGEAFETAASGEALKVMVTT
jgi:L-iditol 2-dehydrogenase